MVKVKICGITNLKDAQAAIRWGADCIGFVFWPKSPRYIQPGRASQIAKELPDSVCKVGVFVDEKEAEVRKVARLCKLDALQFHGKESPSYCNKFKDYSVIKAFRIKGARSLKDIARYRVDYYFLDAFRPGKPGGTGRTFDWRQAVKAKKFGRPIILSGGLGPENVTSAIKRVRPYMVDASSGLEKAPGKKDHRLLKEFIHKVKSVKGPEPK
jgi:phosphoribosylanthranilate isomerase